MPTTLHLDNPHAMDPDRFHGSLRGLLGRVPADDITVLDDTLPGLEGACRECGYDAGLPPIRFVTHTDDARGLVAIIRVRAAMAAGWDGRSGCWGNQLAARRIYTALRRQGTPTAPPAHLWVPRGIT